MTVSDSQDGKGVVLVYATCPDRETALTIARGCVENGHAACANIIDGMTSVFAWEGKIETASEVSLILKTTRKNVAGLQGQIVSAHPYDVPAVLVVPVDGGHAPFLDWVGEATAARTDDQPTGTS